MSDTIATNLSETCYGKVRDTHYDMAILPWGAIEPHNLHLPYLTDSILSQKISVEAAKKAYADGGAKVMVLPAVDGGSQNQGQHTLPFCIHYRYETQKSILTDTVDALHRQGIRKLLIINGHGGNSFKNMIRDLAIDKPDFLIAATEWYTVEKASEYFETKIDDHAAETETSVMMYYYPEKVNKAEAGSGEVIGKFKIESLNQKVAWTPRHWDKTSTDTGVGDPSRATAEKGRRFADTIVAKLSRLLIEMSQNDLY